MNNNEPKAMYVYFLTNWAKTVLYIGVTNNLIRRLKEHAECKNPSSFSTKYKVFYLVYYEIFEKPKEAIEREKQLKKWNRNKKDSLIKSTNPDWHFLNENFTQPI